MAELTEREKRINLDKKLVIHLVRMRQMLARHKRETYELWDTAKRMEEVLEKRLEKELEEQGNENFNA